MKSLIIIALCAFSMNVMAQITLEHDYDKASTIATGSPAVQDQLMLINFEVSGERYVNINRHDKIINIYNLNHTLISTISLASLPLTNTGTLGDFLYFSEQLFNTDSKMEFMYCVPQDSSSFQLYKTIIYNEDEQLLFSQYGYPAIRPNYSQQQYPIYNTSQGTKLILSYTNGHAKVFSLPGTLSADIAKANNDLLSQSSISNPYPNPSISTTQIDYDLPKGINQGEIVFYNLQGKEVKRFKVDKTFNTLLISTSDLAAGTYYYQLQTTTQNSEGKKMVVIK